MTTLMGEFQGVDSHPGTWHKKNRKMRKPKEKKSKKKKKKKKKITDAELTPFGTSLLEEFPPNYSGANTWNGITRLTEIILRFKRVEGGYRIVRLVNVCHSLGSSPDKVFNCRALVTILHSVSWVAKKFE